MFFKPLALLIMQTSSSTDWSHHSLHFAKQAAVLSVEAGISSDHSVVSGTVVNG